MNKNALAGPNLNRLDHKKDSKDDLVHRARSHDQVPTVARQMPPERNEVDDDESNESEHSLQSENSDDIELENVAANARVNQILVVIV